MRSVFRSHAGNLIGIGIEFLEIVRLGAEESLVTPTSRMVVAAVGFSASINKRNIFWRTCREIREARGTEPECW